MNLTAPSVALMIAVTISLAQRLTLPLLTPSSYGELGLGHPVQVEPALEVHVLALFRIDALGCRFCRRYRYEFQLLHLQRLKIAST